MCVLSGAAAALHIGLSLRFVQRRRSLWNRSDRMRSVLLTTSFLRGDPPLEEEEAIAHDDPASSSCRCLGRANQFLRLDQMTNPQQAVFWIVVIILVVGNALFLQNSLRRVSLSASSPTYVLETQPLRSPPSVGLLFHTQLRFAPVQLGHVSCLSAHVDRCTTSARHSGW
jgi:hypothetical protein